MPSPQESLPYCTKFVVHAEFADGKAYEFTYAYDPSDPACTKAKLSAGPTESVPNDFPMNRIPLTETGWIFDLQNACPVEIRSVEIGE